MSTNPFQSPMMVNEPKFGPGDPMAREKVNLPGLFLIIMAGISIAGRVLGLAMAMLGGGLAAAGAQGGDEAAMAVVQLGFGLVGNIIGLIFNGLVVFGGIKMRNLESYTLAMTAAIISVIPGCSPCGCLGIPFGIWALVVLNDAQVKAAFRS